MAGRSELMKRAKQLAEQLDLEIDLRNKTGAQIEEEVAELQALADELASAGDDAEAKAKREAEIERRARAAEIEGVNRARNDFRGAGLKYPYQVAPRKRIQCRFGVLVGGAEIRSEFVGGQAELDKLVASGAVLRRSPG